MIYPATLILATLVFNAASGLGAPVRVTQSTHVSRADSDDLAARKVIVDVPARVRSVEATSENDTRDTSSQPIEARDSLPEVDRLVRRFPRRHLADFYRRSTQPEARSPVEARSEQIEAPELQRRYPRRGLAEMYEKRATPPSEEPVARSEQDEPLYRRFPRKVYADNVKRQEETPAGEPTPAASESPAATADGAAPTGDAAASSSAPAATGAPTATATVSVSTATATIAPSTPLTPGNPGTPANLDVLIANITSTADDGFQEGTTIKETTLFVNKITHISGTKDKAAQNIVESKVIATTVTATPSAPTATASSEAAPSAAVTGTPVEGAPAAESPSATSAPEAQPTTTAAAAGGEPAATGEAVPSGEPSAAGAARRANIRRNVGFSGAAYASYAKRNVN
ncbi:hypothetical protein FA15DRAFT_753996 [Coprinopsis marcescibilis]|uniref:Uncharacterized protein n=1 Tax=Coprinopsis marcescibilis TaxID=230819 RepID=A0A5C3L4U0_COPMA|nr:hypothetical protein FA15DRAFT_753996 [Coprinopsis marcescibilis]